MSRIYYVKDEKGTVLSSDGQTRFKVIEGKELYSYLQSEERKGKYFYCYRDDNDDVIGVECTREQYEIYEKERLEKNYRIKKRKKNGIEIISGNLLVRDSETDVELLETVEDENAGILNTCERQEMIEKINLALESLSKEEREMITALYLSSKPLTEREYSRKTGIPQKTINNRKKKVLEKIKKFL